MMPQKNAKLSCYSRFWLERESQHCLVAIFGYFPTSYYPVRVCAVRLLRLARQLVCAVQNTSNSSVVITSCACSILKVHAQCTQGMCSLELLLL